MNNGPLTFEELQKLMRAGWASRVSADAFRQLDPSVTDFMQDIVGLREEPKSNYELLMEIERQ